MYNDSNIHASFKEALSEDLINFTESTSLSDDLGLLSSDEC